MCLLNFEVRLDKIVIARLKCGIPIYEISFHMCVAIPICRLLIGCYLMPLKISSSSFGFKVLDRHIVSQ